MYLSSKQHDQLQIIVTGFEIPYRSYIATEILKQFPTAALFAADVTGRTASPSRKTGYRAVNSELGKIQAEPLKYYALLVNARKAKDRKIVEDEIDIPLVVTAIAFTIIFKELFTPLLQKFKDEETYLEQAMRYKYVRNKLDHRGCKTLETGDMAVSLDFIDNALLCFRDDRSLFWDKSYEEIRKESQALQTSAITIPVAIHNLADMPFPDARIVCRDKEIAEIKEFVYGRPGALRKQSSFALFGYGGVGKTALVLEAVKQIVQDLQDGTTINGYRPAFILFFTAKEEALDFSQTTGKIQNVRNRYSFQTADQLIQNIYGRLEIASFQGYTDSGLIIVDNLESLSAEERTKVEEFIRFCSPPQIQYIITSRNEENYEYRKKLAGFESDAAGRAFITTYIDENNYDLSLSDRDMETLLKISMGNTLVLVLCLRRLGLNLTTIGGIVSDMTATTTVAKLEREIRQIPANGFNIISEYMFKNSFQEIQENYKSSPLLGTVLKIFAVYPADTIDLYTISMLSKEPYNMIDPLLELLCEYLIIEKVGEAYRLNPFAEKYIIQLFMPDSETFEKIQSDIVASTRKIQSELRALDSDIQNNAQIRNIIQDWSVVSDGDKIAVAKAYKLYRDVSHDCASENAYLIAETLRDAVRLIDTLERNTMHPYVKYQKARILQLINDTHALEEDYTEQIFQAFNDTIWTIKANSLYTTIKGTRSYASVLWLYGMQLSADDSSDACYSAVRYLEESSHAFENLHDTSDGYYQCRILLGEAYLKLYLLDPAANLEYLRKARTVSNQLYLDRDNYYGRTKYRATELRGKLQPYGRM